METTYYLHFQKDLHGYLCGRTKEICEKYESVSKSSLQVGRSKNQKKLFGGERVYECRDKLKRWGKTLGNVTIFR